MFRRKGKCVGGDLENIRNFFQLYMSDASLVLDHSTFIAMEVRCCLVKFSIFRAA